MDAEDRRLRGQRPYRGQPRRPGIVLEQLHLHRVGPACNRDQERDHPGHLDVLLPHSAQARPEGDHHIYDADGALLIRRDNAAAGETVLYLGGTEVHLKSGKKWANRHYTVNGATIALRTNQSGTEKVSFLSADHHGTSGVAVSSDTTQALSKRYTTPFGVSRGTGTGTWPDEKAFLGKSADAGTGLTHVSARE